MLPNERVLIVTNRRVMLIKAPGFAQLEYEALSGNLLVVDDVPPGSIKWELEWMNVLTAELIWSRNPRPGPSASATPTAPNAIIVHR